MLLFLAVLAAFSVLPTHTLNSFAQIVEKQAALVAAVVLRGTDAQDVLEGTAAGDLLEGLGGADSLFGMAGDDILRGGDGDDTLDGGPGDDGLSGGAGDDILDGVEGSDTLTGGDGDDTLDGGDGEDALDGGPGVDDLEGGDEDDLLRGGDGDDKLSGGDGNDVVSGGAGRDAIRGGDGQDVLSGGADADVIEGGDGVDALFGGAGDDVLDGHDDDDVVRGDGGSDRLTGGLGNDSLSGGEGNDALAGGEGNDVLAGDAGDDHLLGGLGVDSCAAGAGDDVIVVRAGDVPADLQEMLDGGEGSDTLILEGFSAGDITRPAQSGVEGTGTTYAIRDPLTGGTYTATGIEHVQYGHTLTTVSAAADARSSILLTNPSAEPAVGTLTLFDKDGKPIVFAVAEKDKKEVTAQPITVPPLGRIELPAEAASAEVRTDRPTGALARADSFIIPVSTDRAPGLTTGVAIVCGDTPCKIKITPYELEGAEIGGETGARDFDLPPHGQAIRFAHELFPRLPNFEGTMTVEGGPLAAVGLDAHTDGRILGVFPGVPSAAFLSEKAAALAAAPAHVARIAAGDGSSHTLVIVNAGPGTAKGAVAFFGENGAPVAMPLEGLAPAASVPFELASGAAVMLKTSSSGAAVTASAQITGGPGVAALVRLSLPGGTGTGAPAMAAVESFIAPVDRQTSTGLTTEVTLSSAGAASKVTLVLRDAAGREIQGGRADIQLPANGHAARTIDQWFPNADTSDFHGTMTAVATGGTIAATVIVAQPGAGGRLAMMPVTRLQ